MQEVKAIAKWENGAPILFLPEDSANIGRIVCYAHMSQHSEACLAYYRGLKNPPNTSEAKAALAALIREYEHLGPPIEHCRVELIKRDSAKLRSARYEWVKQC